MIINVNTLPEPLHRRIRSDRVRVQVHDESGIITLTPIQDHIKDSKEDKPHYMFIGVLSQESYDEICTALVDTQRVDIDEW
jgi:hypothetical protein